MNCSLFVLSVVVCLVIVTMYNIVPVSMSSTVVDPAHLPFYIIPVDAHEQFISNLVEEEWVTRRYFYGVSLLNAIGWGLFGWSLRICPLFRDR